MAGNLTMDMAKLSANVALDILPLASANAGLQLTPGSLSELDDLRGMIDGNQQDAAQQVPPSTTGGSTPAGGAAPTDPAQNTRSGQGLNGLLQMLLQILQLLMQMMAQSQSQSQSGGSPTPGSGSQPTPVAGGLGQQLPQPGTGTTPTTGGTTPATGGVSDPASDPSYSAHADGDRISAMLAASNDFANQHTYSQPGAMTGTPG